MSAWPVTRLGEVIRQRRDFIQVDDLREYTRPRVQLHAQGIVVRDTVPGAMIKTKKQQVCRAGEFLVAEIDAKVGGFGLVPPELDGAIVSSHYFLFEVDERKLDRRFLDYFSRTRAFRDQVEAQGSTNYAAIRPAEVLDYEIPLPPLPEQRRVVARIEEVAGLVGELHSLGEEFEAADTALEISQAHRRDLSDKEKIARGWELVPLAEVIEQVEDRVAVCADASYPNFGILSFGRGLFEKPAILGLESSAQFLNRVRAGQFIYSRLFAFEGAYGRVTPEYDGWFVSNEYPTFRCDPERVVASFLVAYFKPKEIWRSVAEGSKGLGDRRQRVQPSQILRHTLWLPPLEVQLRAEQIGTERLAAGRLRADSSAALDALLPAVLDRAFRGEL